MYTNNFFGRGQILTRLTFVENTSEKKCAQFWDISRMPRGASTMFLLHQRFIGNLLKKYRSNLGGMDKIEIPYRVGNVARNLINVKRNSKNQF